ncbi:hypothetical protein TNCV_3106451 [Trichonephila clavipes]|nr:hypothetical protein TNCV_3106451 [Trichonephila clavipes]
MQTTPKGRQSLKCRSCEQCVKKQRKRTKTATHECDRKHCIGRLSYNKCSNLQSEVVWYTSQWRSMEVLTFWKIAGMSRMRCLRLEHRTLYANPEEVHALSNTSGSTTF